MLLNLSQKFEKILTNNGKKGNSDPLPTPNTSLTNVSNLERSKNGNQRSRDIPSPYSPPPPLNTNTHAHTSESPCSLTMLSPPLYNSRSPEEALEAFSLLDRISVLKPPKETREQHRGIQVIDNSLPWHRTSVKVLGNHLLEPDWLQRTAARRNTRNWGSRPPPSTPNFRPTTSKPQVQSLYVITPRHLFDIP